MKVALAGENANDAEKQKKGEDDEEKPIGVGDNELYIFTELCIKEIFLERNKQFKTITDYLLMKIKIDMREKALINKIVPLCNILHLKVDISVELLPLGDILIVDDNDVELLIIERKTLNDLAASIKDGRYEEQAFRLNNNMVHNHNIIYLIEGDLNLYSDKYTRIPKKTLYSAIFCLNYYKGFSVIRTIDISDTAEFLLRIVDKLSREKSILGNYNGGKSDNILNYCEVVKKRKKNNITPTNIGAIVLSQLPGISSVTAMAIMEKFNSLYALLETLHIDKNCLNELSYTLQNGKTRRISKTSIENIIKFLLPLEKNKDNFLNCKITL